MIDLVSTPFQQIVWLAQPLIVIVLFFFNHGHHARKQQRPAWARMNSDRVLEAATAAFACRDPEELVPILKIDRYPSMRNAGCWQVSAPRRGRAWTAKVHDDTGVVDIPEPPARPRRIIIEPPRAPYSKPLRFRPAKY